MQLNYKLGSNAPPIMEGLLRRWMIKHLCIAGILAVAAAESYRRLHTVPHIRRRTEYYEGLGVHWKPIV